MKFEYSFVVRGHEMDSFGHVNNAVYLQYLEQARWEIIREAGLVDIIHAHGLLLIVVDVHVRYMRELKVYDRVRITSDVSYQPPYIIYRHGIYNDTAGTKAARGTVKTVLLGPERKPVDPPPELDAVLGRTREPETEQSENTPS